jgi:hypothetical protein
VIPFLENPCGFFGWGNAHFGADLTHLQQEAEVFSEGLSVFTARSHG